MKVEPIHLRVAGVCVLATAFCAVAGAVVSLSFGLGGQNLPVATREQLVLLAENRVPFLIREWFYLFVAVFAVGEGLGLYFLLRSSPLAIWALVAWILGLSIGIVEDAAVIALIEQVARMYPVATEASRDSMFFAARLAFETIKIQQFVANILCSGVGLFLFGVVGLRSKVIPRRLCIIGVLAAVTTGWCFGFCNVVLDSDQGVVLFENGFALLVIWDLAVGILLLSAATKAR